MLHSAVTCVPVLSGDELTTFIRMPRLLYGAMENYVPRLDIAERQALDPKRAPFFRHGKARYWTAWRRGKPVGRISAQIDHLQAEPFGMFGCLDAVDDRETVFSLLGEAENWLCEQGRTIARGPFSLSINGECGLMTEGQQARSMTMMPWHPSYLAEHVGAAGYRDVRSLLSYTLDLRNVQAAELMGAVRSPRLPQSIRIRGLNTKDLDSEAALIAQIYNDAWRNNWGFVPISAEEVATLARAFRLLLVPECGVFVEVDGAPIAVALILPNLAELTGDFGGTLSPLDWVRLLYRATRKDYRSGRLILFGVVERVRNSILGAAVPFAMLNEFARNSGKYRLSELELSWVLENNWPAQSIIRRFGGRLTKRYSLFERIIDQGTAPSAVERSELVEA